MLDDIGMQVMELGAQGYCCTQIMVLLALDEMDRENPDLVRAASGFCNGMGDGTGPCGVYAGANLLLGLYAGKGLAMEQADGKLALMLEEFAQWFVSRTSAHAGIRCLDILDGSTPQMNTSLCGSLLADAHGRVREILLDNGCDPTEGRELL
ncbi:DVU_1555 family C-GCAxxG-C-C protein [Desulfotalea psychrophila]|uniref:C_GCAxxG_C_C family protein n=1 Tax=Desulfotalea psychrophila (strain LSv54 / DSM 12343) TaxID=177439 RepID=Q6ARN0_DESPS|nr:DV_1555 family C-GCAxxG-C-C protein [Desulfotalea psychrophila]CAG34995.1 unknown protein [Desulfotalea psychrophila LSv54]